MGWGRQRLRVRPGDPNLSGFIPNRNRGGLKMARKYRFLETGDWVRHIPSGKIYMVVRQDGGLVHLLGSWGIFPYYRNILRAIPKDECNSRGYYGANVRALAYHYKRMLINLEGGF